MLLDINYNLVRIFIADAWVSVCMWVCVAFEMYVVIVWEDVGKICSNEWAECGALAINDTVRYIQRVQMRDREVSVEMNLRFGLHLENLDIR